MGPIMNGLRHPKLVSCRTIDSSDSSGHIRVRCSRVRVSAAHLPILQRRLPVPSSCVRVSAPHLPVRRSRLSVPASSVRIHFPSFHSTRPTFVSRHRPLRSPLPAFLFRNLSLPVRKTIVPAASATLPPAMTQFPTPKSYVRVPAPLVLVPHSHVSRSVPVLPRPHPSITVHLCSLPIEQWDTRWGERCSSFFAESYLTRLTRLH